MKAMFTYYINLHIINSKLYAYLSDSKYFLDAMNYTQRKAERILEICSNMFFQAHPHI